MMRLHVFFGITDLIWPFYAVDFLEILESIYPGYHAAQGFGSVK